MAIAVHQLYCVMRSASHPGDSFTWRDEFGNTLTGIFTTPLAAWTFIQNTAPPGRLFAHEFRASIFLANIKQQIAFYAIDPVSVHEFKTLTTEEMLADLICRAYEAGIKAGVAIVVEDAREAAGRAG
jgi:hypothetical protein